MNDLRVVTANVDFTLRKDKVQDDLERIIERADIITFQEAKPFDIDRLIRDNDWEVFQPMATDATRGSGVAWRKSVGIVKARGKRVGTTPHGRGLLTRYIVWVKLVVDGEPLIVGSVHLPPKRYWGLIYNLMIGSISAFLGGKEVPVLLGGDWNKIVERAEDLRRLAGSFNGQLRGVHIDGFLLIGKGKWKFVSDALVLFNTNSDHSPVQVKLRKLTGR